MNILKINKLRKRFNSEYNENLEEIKRLNNLINNNKRNSLSFKIYIACIFSLMSILFQIILFNLNVFLLIKPLLFVSSILSGILGSFLVSKYNEAKSYLKGKTYVKESELFELNIRLEIEKERIITQNKVLKNIMNRLNEKDDVTSTNIKETHAKLTHNKKTLYKVIQNKVLDLMYNKNDNSLIRYVLFFIFSLCVYNIPTINYINLLDIIIPSLFSLLSVLIYNKYESFLTNKVYNKLKTDDYNADIDTLTNEYAECLLDYSLACMQKEDIIETYQNTQEILTRDKEKKLNISLNNNIKK